MKQSIINFIKKQWLVMLILVAAVTLITIIASAEAMITLSPMKRVLVTKAGHGVLFSSNLLSELIDETVGNETVQKATYQPVYKTLDTSRSDYTVDLFLWNHNISDETTVYPENINYRLEAVLTDAEGNELTSGIGTHSVIITQTKPVPGTPISLTLDSSNPSGDLTGTILYSNTGYYTDNIYQVSFSNPPDGWDLDDDIDICVQIKAIPTLKDDNSPYTDIPTIGRILGLRKSRITGSNGWKANISEKTETNSPSPFDAYNLVLSGSGAATITISWDITKIDVNPFFYDSSNNVYHFDFTSNPAEIVDQGVTNGIHTIKINADTGKQSQNYRNIYKLQLYKLDGDPSSWAQLLGDWVTVDIQ